MSKKEKKKKNHYFTKVHEDAIVEYVSTEDRARREELYRELIGPAFDEMVDKIIYTYKFTELNNIEFLKEDCKVWLSTILSKYDPDKGSKAFSYYSVVIKNWFIQKTKKRSRQLMRESSFEEIQDYLEENVLITEETYETTREKEEFVQSLKEEIETWDKGRRNLLLGKNDQKMIQAIKILFEHADEIEIFNKKAIYLNLRELTGLNTKQITRSLKKLSERYDNFRERWEDGEI